MIDKQSIIKMVNAIVRKDKGYPDKRLMHPQREWFIGLVLFTCVVLFGGFFAGDIFIIYQNIESVEGDSGENIPRYRDTIVDQALEKYRARTLEYETLVNKKISVEALEENFATTSGSFNLNESESDMTNIELSF